MALSKYAQAITRPRWVGQAPASTIFFYDPSKPGTLQTLGDTAPSPYAQWWELSEPTPDEVAALRRQRWWWLLGGVAAGFLIGGVVYAKV